MCQRLAARVRCVVCTQPNNPRAMPAGELAKEFEAQGIRAYALCPCERRAGRGAAAGRAGGQRRLRGLAVSDRRDENGAEGKKGTSDEF